MPLSPGTRLGHYDVTALLGEGGMGQVWQATDTQLNRQVALKILPDAFAADPDRLARFQREAQILASLNHPNIAAIFGIEESKGTRALVLELVEGPTLADRIAKGPIPLDEALPIAKQIAEALEAAHEAGVIHRDLKPANIKVREDGTVKVLDFGLAKALDPASASATADPSQSPTLTAAATQMGVIMGTAAYMSPEQARGKPVDKRADIWAFGAVLFEMLSGKRPFEGRDVSEVLGAVLRLEPDWDLLPADTPPRIRTLVQRCLEKEPKQRVHDVADVRLAMAGGFETTVSASAESELSTPPQTWQRPGVGLGIVAAAVLVTGLTVLSVTRPTPPAPRPVARFILQTPPDVPLRVFSEVAISPTGTHVVYSTGSEPTRGGELYVRELGELEASPLRGSEGGFAPFFSHDGQSVGFVSGEAGRLLKRISVHGGSPTTIVALETGFQGASWGADDTIVFGSRTGLMRVPAVGGESEPLTTIDPAQAVTTHAFPDVLPNLKGVLFTEGRGSIEESRVAVVSLETGAVSYLLQAGSNAQYASTGHIVYSGDGGRLWAVGFDEDRLELTSANPVPVMEGVYGRAVGTRGALFALADNGSLVYTGDASETVAPSALVWVDRDGEEELLETPLLPYQWASVSPDGTRVAYAESTADADIWLHDLERGTETRLTTDPGRDYAPLWAPDSQSIVFTSERAGGAALFQKAVDGPGNAERLVTENRGVTNMGPTGWSADGRTLLFWEARARPPDIGLLAMDGDRSVQWLIDTQTVEINGTVSPDGGWMAYEAYEITGRPEVYVQRFPGLGGKQTISTDGGQHPLWSPDGQELFYRSPTAMMRVPLLDVGQTFRAGSPEPLFETPNYPMQPGRAHDLHPDGQRFLMIKGAASTSEALAPAPAQIVLVENWFSELERLVPTN